MPKLRSEEEVQKAHDVLVAYLNGEVENAVIDDGSRRLMASALEAICWVLHHDHSEFGSNLESLMLAARLGGGEFRRTH